MTQAWQTETTASVEAHPLDQASERADALAELEHCVYELVRLQEIESSERENDFPDRSIEHRRNALLAQTAAGLASNVYEIAEALRSATFTTLANCDGIDDWDMNTLFDGRELALIDTYCLNLCGSRLTAFVRSVERKFNPTNGVPLDCPNPERYDPARLFPSTSTDIFLQGCGMAEEHAVEVARLQRMDLRERTEENWEYLEEQLNSLRNSQREQER